MSLEELEKGLIRYLNQDDADVAERLKALYDRWQLRPRDEYILLAEADLDGDGDDEVATALNVAGGLTGTGALFVIDRRDGRVAVDRWTEEDLPGVRLFAVADLTGDGRPEIVWSSTQVGAHTAHTTVFVSTWEPGWIRNLPGPMRMASARLALDSGDLLLRGGLIGSVGAGGLQRERTDRYRWVDGAFRLVDRVYARSDFSYHRLLDGIAAETFGKAADAERAFREAMEPGRPVAPMGAVESEQTADFEESVRTFARFRLAALQMKAGNAAAARETLAGPTGPFAGLLESLAAATDRVSGCRAAEEWTRANPAFLEALASPIGYANPVWQPEDLCGPLPEFGQ